MKLKADAHLIGDFSGKKPKLRQEYWKTYYCVFYLKEDWYDRRSHSLGSCATKHFYKRGYYVFPVYLGVEYSPRYGDSVTVYSINGYLGEPKDSTYSDRERCWEFKNHFGLSEDWCPNKVISKIETCTSIQAELYDNVDEAIERAKILDELLALNEAIFNKNYYKNKLSEELKNLNELIDRYKTRKVEKPQKFSMQSELTLQSKLITKENKLEKIKKLQKEVSELEEKISTFVPFSI